MQISRHWRLNAQRYRLEGTRYPNGSVNLQNRPQLPLYEHLLGLKVELPQSQPIAEVNAA
ncbi:MAG: hypothetical protein MUF87_14045 [Anaerolineae bacterium]|jgi:hypothetical protein|nr:hypothetical protein [Anaerolineae bacterium]